MSRTKREGRGFSRAAVISAVVCLALGAAVGLPRFLEWRQGKEEERQLKEAIQAQAVEYQEGEPFTLHGDTSASDTIALSGLWGWDGDLQFKYSNLQAFRTLEEAGFTPEEIGDWGPWDDASWYICVDLDLTNVNAHCPAWFVEEMGGEGISANTFSLSAESGYAACEIAALSGTTASLPNYYPEKARGYIWAEPGSTSHYRIAFAYDGESLPQHPRLVLDIGGEFFGIITVNLGELSAA